MLGVPFDRLSAYFRDRHTPESHIRGQLGTSPYFRFALLVEGDGVAFTADLLTLRLSVHLVADPPYAAPWLTLENTARF
jgi:hypothetical protein